MRAIVNVAVVAVPPIVILIPAIPDGAVMVPGRDLNLLDVQLLLRTDVLNNFTNQLLLSETTNYLSVPLALLSITPLCLSLTITYLTINLSVSIIPLLTVITPWRVVYPCLAT